MAFDSNAARAAMARSGPKHIASITTTTTASTATSLSAYMGEVIYFAARTATVYINFGATGATATSACYPIARGTAEEWLITPNRSRFSVISASTATCSYGWASG